MTSGAGRVVETVDTQNVVYVVDDDPGMRDALKSLLGSVGLRVEAFGAASEFLGKKLPDAAVCLVVTLFLGLYPPPMIHQVSVASEKVAAHATVPHATR